MVGSVWRTRLPVLNDDDFDNLANVMPGEIVMKKVVRLEGPLYVAHVFDGASWHPLYEV